MPSETTNLEVQSDANGAWKVDFLEKLSPGQHTITAIDETGSQDQVMVYVVKEPPAPAETKIELIDRVTTLMPPFFLFAFLALVLIIIALLANMVRLARKASQGEMYGLKRHYLRNAIIFCVIVLAVTCTIGIWLNRKTNFVNRYLQTTAPVFESVKISGKILDPLTMQGISGIDLTSGDTTIHTSGSGQFIFDNVSAASGVIITHPDLLRSVSILPDKSQKEQNVNIYANISLLNTLGRVVDLESRGKFVDVYAYLAPEIRQKVKQEEYVKQAGTFFGPQNITDQTLKILQTKIADKFSASKYELEFARVVEITVDANGQMDTYFFTNSDNGWLLVD